MEVFGIIDEYPVFKDWLCLSSHQELGAYSVQRQSYIKDMFLGEKPHHYANIEHDFHTIKGCP